MRWTGKIIGAAIGFIIIPGPVGFILGLLVGHLFDAGYFKRLLGGAQSTHTSKVQQVFFKATFMVMGHIAKSDGRVSEQEIAAARNVMAQLNLSETNRHQAIDYFNQGKQSGFDVKATLDELKRSCWSRPTLLRTFLEIQIYMAHVEGPLTAQKRAALQFVCTQLGVGSFSFEQFEQQYQAGQNYRQTGGAYVDPKQHLKAAYELLGVSASATDAEVKKAYRRQMSKNHPDRLIAKGLPPEMVKLATQKTQQIKSAYETIKKTRGMR